MIFLILVFFIFWLRCLVTDVEYCHRLYEPFFVRNYIKQVSCHIFERGYKTITYNILLVLFQYPDQRSVMNFDINWPVSSYSYSELNGSTP